MLQEQYAELMQAAANGSYMSIAINLDGTPVHGSFVPWERTASAFNMRTPKVTLAVSDLQNAEIMQALKKCILRGCYIFSPLEDYSFLDAFEGIWDLFILHGENIKDLSFVSKMTELFMFYLEDASLPDLKPLVEICNKGASLPGKCLGFYHCKIEDTSALTDMKTVISELLVWPTPDDDENRWKLTRTPGLFRFYK